jgi:elongation factor Ts
VEAGKKFRSTLFLCEALNVRQDSITGFVDEEKKRTMTTEAVVKIDAKQVKELREKSGAPMGDCLKALQEAKGEMEAAFVVLRKRGMATAAKKASRTTNEGVVGTYIHAGGKIGVLVELNCESDFVARTDDFQELLRDVAMHIAASEPRFVGRDEVTAEDIEREKDIYRAQAAASGKPPAIVEKMLVGKLGKFYEEFCLLDQPFIKDQTQTIAQIVAAKVAKLGENISVRRFARFKVGAADWTVAQTKAADAPQG